MATKPVIAWDEDSNRFSLLGYPKSHALAQNTYASEAEALKAWGLWHRSVKPKKVKPGRVKEFTLRQAQRYGVCQQCFGPAWKDVALVVYRHYQICELPQLTVCGMNLCARCYAVHEKSVAAGLLPTEEIPF